MDEEHAEAVAKALGGEPWNSGGGIWLVVLRRQDGSVVVVSGDVVCEYGSEEAFEASEAAASIVLH